MKKIFLTICLAAFGLALAAQTAADEVGKVVQAIGGAEAVQKWTALQSEGDLTFPNGNAEINGKYRLVRSGAKKWQEQAFKFGGETYVMISGYDGQAAWSERMGQVSDQPALNEETSARHGIDLLLKKDAAWTLGKTGEVDGKKAISLEADCGGKKTVFWIDPQTHLVVEISYKDLFIGDKEIKEELDMRLRYDDYQKIDNVMFPMKTTTFQKGRKGGELRFTKVVFNPKIAPALFQRPAQKVDLRYDEELID